MLALRSSRGASEEVVEHSAHEAAVLEYCKGFWRFWKVGEISPLGRCHPGRVQPRSGIQNMVLEHLEHALSLCSVFQFLRMRQMRHSLRLLFHVSF